MKEHVLADLALLVGVESNLFEVRLMDQGQVIFNIT